MLTSSVSAASHDHKSMFRCPLLLLEKWKKGKFKPQKVPMDISEKNETNAMHRQHLRASNSVNGKVFLLLL